jgi:hypothetical protein
MSNPQDETKRVQFLLTNLVILTVVILGLITLVAIYPRLFGTRLAPRPTSSPAAVLAPSETPTITATPTVTRTPRPTLTPTITPTASETPIPSLTPTPTGPPTLTPARPAANDPYRLAAWNPEQADLAIAMMNDFPNTQVMSDTESLDQQAFFDSFFYATVAEREGLLRFPKASQASPWSWSLAYNLARTGEPQAGQAYADLIGAALNQGEVTSKELSEWFHENEPRLELVVTPLKAPSGYSGSNLIEVRGPGSAFIHLLETPGSYRAQVLSSDFNFVRAPQAGTVLADFTRDGAQELAVFYDPPYSLTVENPQVFNLGKVVSDTLQFRPSDDAFLVGIDFPNQWKAVMNSQGGSDLQFESRMFPACPVTVRRTYHWDGNFFTFTDASYAVKPDPTTFPLCRYLVDQAANLWGPEAAIQIMEPLLDDWPPAQDESGQPFLADTADEWRFRLGIYHALLGESDQAIQYMTEIVTDPSDPASRYLAPAAAFLEAYQEPEDNYRACLPAPFCDPQRAMEYLLNQAEIPEGMDPIKFLTDQGAVMRAQGFFDFDNDGQGERWFTLRHRPLEKLDFWILAPQKEGIKGLFAGYLESDAPQLSYLDEETFPPIVLINGADPFQLLRDPDTAEPYLFYPDLPDFYPNRFQEPVDELGRRLLAGEDPEIIRDALLALVRDLGLMCKASWTCDSYYYYLGLAYELAGDKTDAVATYKLLWDNYSKSPFTTLARLKLESTLATPTPVASPTPTATTTPTITPTLPATPTATLTPTTSPTVSATAGPSPTPTRTATPGSYVVSTPIPTINPYP